MSTEKLLKQELGTALLKSTGVGGGGCISQGTVYDTDFGKVFIKVNNEPDALQMFKGEHDSLEAIFSSRTVVVPKPIKVLENPKGGAMLVMEYLDFKGLRKYEERLGELMARLHLHNSNLKAKSEKCQQSIHTSVSQNKGEGTSEQPGKYVSQYGFSVTTCCGYLPQDNSWMDSWLFGDRQAGEAWSTLLPHLPKLFNDVTMTPALLHGDLWSGNAGETVHGPVVFDPASFYGHSEFDLAISTMFGGFGRKYFSSYHSIIPKQKGFEARQDLYCMFHYLNHWNHFGSGYKSSTLQLLLSLVKRYT